MCTLLHNGRSLQLSVALLTIITNALSLFHSFPFAAPGLRHSSSTIHSPQLASFCVACARQPSQTGSLFHYRQPHNRAAHLFTPSHCTDCESANRTLPDAKHVPRMSSNQESLLRMVQPGEEVSKGPFLLLLAKTIEAASLPKRKRFALRLGQDALARGDSLWAPTKECIRTCSSFFLDNFKIIDFICGFRFHLLPFNNFPCLMCSAVFGEHAVHAAVRRSSRLLAFIRTEFRARFSLSSSKGVTSTN